MTTPNHHVRTPVPFPHPDATNTTSPQASSASTPTTPTAKRARTSTNASTTSVASRLRTASIKAMEASPPPGMWAATGSVTAKAPTLADIRTGSFSDAGWKDEPQRVKAERRGSQSETNARIKRTGSDLHNVNDNESPSTMRMDPSDKRRSQGTQPVGPFPTLTEEDSNPRPPQEKIPGHDISQAPSFEDAKQEDLKDGSKIKGKGQSSSEQEDNEDTQQVCQLASLRCAILTQRTVPQRLHASSEAPMDHLNHHRPESVLEVVPHNTRFPHHTVRLERGSVGRHVVPPPAQRCARHVHPNMRRPPVTEAYLGRD